MKISYIKLKKKKNNTILISLILVLVIIISSFVGSFFERYSNDRITDASVKPNYQTIIIDAGHGGEDSGAVSPNGILEKDLNIKIAFLIGEELTNRGYKIIYTRTEDKLLYAEEENIKGLRKISDLKNRCKIADKNPNAIFVSIHMNSFAEEKYSGLQVYYSTKNENSRLLADKIQNRVREDLQKENTRKVKSGEKMYLMKKISNVGVLIECGFLTNEKEAEKLKEKEYQKNLSFSIVCGIIEYIEN